MFKSPWRTFLVLLSVALVALCSGLLLRQLIVNNFHHYVEGERLALVRLVSSDLQGNYEKYKGWNREATAEDAARALMLGIQVKVLDARGEVVMETGKALALLPSERKARVLAASGFSDDDTNTVFQTYPLVINGEQAGRLDVKFLSTGMEDLFIKRSGTVVLALSFLLAGLALMLGRMISRKTAALSTQPVQAAARNNADVKAGMQVAEKRERASFPEMPGPGPEKNIPSQGDSEKTVVAGVREKKHEEAALEDALDADDEDMQPLTRDGDRISTIVKGLDELAKAQALGRSLRKGPVELEPYLKGILEKTRGSVPDKDVTFNLECESTLSLTTDPDCLTKIMTNLLDNAVKAVKKSGVVFVSAAAKKGQVVFAVRDTGTGISRKALPHIFEQFYRGSGNGIGLGLAIVRELVDACGGTIEVQSTRGTGSTFIVSIPLA